MRYAATSYWLETADDDLTPRPALRGEVEADVAILGAGFTGLWTAYYLLRRRPGLRVVILEREIAGFGASGRNGGWCTGEFPMGPATLEARYGPEAARAIGRAMYETVDEVGRIASEEGIDAQFRKGGELLVARGAHGIPALDEEYAALRRLGLDDGCARLDAAGLAGRVRIAGAVGALYNAHCAVIHPGRLVRGLARAVERRGGVIYERSGVRAVRGGAAPGRPLGPRSRVLETAGGAVRARSVVLAGEAYLSGLRAYHRHVLPLYSLIVLTEPIPEERWAAIGWAGHEGIASTRYTVDYLSRTMDGRLLFGGRGAPYHYGSGIRNVFDKHEPTHTLLRRMVTEWFPAFGGARFTHAWGGPLGAPRDWMPTMSYDPASGIAYAGGYTGQGVATSNLAGRVLSDLILGEETPLTALPMVAHNVRLWEREPLRWLGVRYAQWGLHRVDERAERTGVPPSGRTPAERLGRH